VDVIRAVGIKLFQSVVQIVGGIVSAEMFEAPENSKELSHSAHANGMNE
jgi:hypothetical protein